MGLSESEQRRAVEQVQEAMEALRRSGLDPETTNSILQNARTVAAVLQQHVVLDKIKVAQTASALGALSAGLVASGAWGTKSAATWAARFSPGLQGVAAAAEKLRLTSLAVLDSIGGIASALTVLADAAKTARTAYEEALPENLRTIPNLSLARLCDFMAEEGVSLYAVPRTSIAEAFLAAPDHAAVRALLSSRATSILKDCRSAWEEASDAPATQEWIRLLDSAASAYEAGHSEAAQALIGVVLDSIMFALPGDQRRRRTKHAFGDTDYKHLLDEDDIATALVAIPLWKAYAENWAAHGHPVPAEFNRHATLHRASKRQYSKRNAIQSLMLATSLVAWYAIYEAPNTSAGGARLT